MKTCAPADNLPSDGELLRGIAHQDQEALSQLYRRYCNLVYSLAFYTLYGFKGRETQSGLN